MKRILLAIATACSFCCHAQQAGILAPGATVLKLAGGFEFTEGPASDKQGNVFFTDQPNDRILKWSTEGELSTFMQPCGRANGLCFDRKGNLWVAADEKNELWRIDKEGKVTTMARHFEGKLFNGPNDIWISRKGRVFFTDPFYKRAYWKRGPREMTECVYSVAANGKDLTKLISDLKQPNGIIGTPDGKLLYVADIGDSKTYSYHIEKGGSLSDRRLYCSMGSDGMTIDDHGNVYLTNKGVFVFDPAGRQIEHIEVPEPWTANVCFGGKDRRALFITASKGLYSVKTSVSGVDSQ